jgi:hypothetical protein
MVYSSNEKVVGNQRPNKWWYYDPMGNAHPNQV